MPSAKSSQSSAVDMSGYGRIDPPPTPVTTGDESTAQSNHSAFMLSSMPLLASTADLFQRQFYGGGALPQQRILPPAARRNGTT